MRQLKLREIVPGHVDLSGRGQGEKLGLWALLPHDNELKSYEV